MRIYRNHADLRKDLGHEQEENHGETRPAVVVSNDAACRCDAVLQVVPITALPDRPLRPYEAALGPADSGLAKPSRAVANQIRTVTRQRIVDRLGAATPAELQAIERAVLIQLGIGYAS